jgi:hypothetical protein
VMDNEVKVFSGEELNAQVVDVFSRVEVCWTKD